MSKERLGRGLDSMFPNSNLSNNNVIVEKNKTILQINVNEIRRNPQQPRLDIDPQSLEELANSIKEKGVLQPVLVRQLKDGFELIAGERRLEAVKQVGMKYIPAIVTDVVSDSDMLEYALIENIQRENLNPVEEALAYDKLNREYHLSHEEIALRVGKNRATVSNQIRLLQLSMAIRAMIVNQSISTGHAKVLLTLENSEQREKLAQKTVEKKLSVRQLEQEIDNLKKQKKTTLLPPVDPFIEAAQTDLMHHLGTKVKINHDEKQGKIVIEYFSLDDLNRIIKMITGMSETS